MCIEILKLGPDIRRVIRFRTGVYILTLFIRNPPAFFEKRLWTGIFSVNYTNISKFENLIFNSFNVLM